MIITKKKALSIVMSVSVIKDIPQLHSAYEAAKKKNAEVLRVRGCNSCHANSDMSTVSDQALNAIISLSRDGVNKLKKALGINEELYAYSSTPTGVQLIQLGA